MPLESGILIFYKYISSIFPLYITTFVLTQYNSICKLS